MTIFGITNVKFFQISTNMPGILLLNSLTFQKTKQLLPLSKTNRQVLSVKVFHISVLSPVYCTINVLSEPELLNQIMSDN